MKHTVTIDKAKPCLYLRLVAESLKDNVSFKWDSVTALKLAKITLHSPEAISRHLARSNPNTGQTFFVNVVFSVAVQHDMSYSIVDLN